MKYAIPLIAVGLAAGCGTALAAEYGTVISSTPVTAQLAVPQQQCRDERQLVQPRTSGAGTLLGALAGGVVGNNIGGGMGRAAATGLGVVAGAVLGEHVEAANSPPAETTMRSCQTLTSYERHVIGYDVLYEYNGQRYSARMPQDPGMRMALDVTVAPTGGTVAVAPVSPLPIPVETVVSPVVYAPAPGFGYYGFSYGAPSIAVVQRGVIGGYRRRGF